MSDGEKDWARPLVHWEIHAKDPERAKAFYGELFNWNVGDGKLKAIPAGIGGPEPGPGGHILEASTPRVVLYFQVRDLRASLDKAATLGGEVTREPFDIPTGQTLAWINDPEGNPVVLVQQ